jgi:hypothetical protein
MSERTLSTRELNRALLARQLLLGRRRLGVPAALERMCGLQAQYAPSMYVGLWSRVEGLERRTVTRALERRTAVQATLMRGTIHLVSAADYWPFEQAVRRARAGWALRVMPDAPPPERMTGAVDKLERRLASGPMTRQEMQEAVGAHEARVAVMLMDLVRVPPSGTWERRRADLYGLAADWIGPSDIGEGGGTVRLVRSYLAGFGPSTRHEIGAFAGLPLGAVDDALERLDLRRFRAEDGAELLDLRRAPLPPADTPAPVRFLPTWDAALLAHARRSGLLPEAHRSKVFHTHMPQSVGTFTVDGVVAGTWAPREGAIAVEPFEDLSRDARAEVDAEAARLAAFHA